MKITTLVENTSHSSDLKAQHGLSLFIETQGHKILFDLGQDQLFLENAQKLDIDIRDVDFVIISHGHYDHGGGLSAFLKVNTKAKIILSRHAFEEHYSSQKDGTYKNIGLDQDCCPKERFIWIDEDTQINSTLKVHTHIQPRALNPHMNQLIYMRKNKEMVHDDFSHEISLVITEEHQKVLIAGCAHSGITNILEQVSEREGQHLNTVISGFHLFSQSQSTSEDPVLVQQIALTLMKTPTLFYTCHCTGLEAYQQMKHLMKDQLEYLYTGKRLQL